jgi:CRP/FNR family transcriptional regulator, cyclic AMP receptor protein
VRDEGVPDLGSGRPRDCSRESPRTVRCLLDIDRDLAEELDSQMLPAARAAAVVSTFEAEQGRLPVAEWLGSAPGGPGVLILDGVIVVNVQVGDRIAAELIGPGDLLQPISREHDELLSCDVTWRALVESRFALLDHGFAKRVRFWPQINQALLRRAGRRGISLNIQRAIAAQPRLEVRLTLLLWHLAARWGRTERDGIRLPLPLTHHLLGQLVAAERPSVTHALTRLARAGVLTGHDDEWHLYGRLEDQLHRWGDRGGRQLVVGLGAFRTS